MQAAAWTPRITAPPTMPKYGFAVGANILDFDTYETMPVNTSESRKRLALVDSGSSLGIAGERWLEGLKMNLAEFHLQPIVTDLEKPMTFNGLGGATRDAKRVWEIPVGVYGRHVATKFYEVPGGVIGLYSREDLSDNRANLYFRGNTTIVDFETLGIYGQELDRLPNGHAALDLLAYDIPTIGFDPVFDRFRVETATESLTALHVNNVSTKTVDACPVERDDWVQIALKAGKTGALPSRVCKALN
jgi:hypothetical protein